MTRYEAEAIWAWVAEGHAASIREVWRLNHLPLRLNDEASRQEAADFLRTLAEVLTAPDTMED